MPNKRLLPLPPKHPLANRPLNRLLPLPTLHLQQHPLRLHRLPLTLHLLQRDARPGFHTLQTRLHQHARDPQCERRQGRVRVYDWLGGGLFAEVGEGSVFYECGVCGSRGGAGGEEDCGV